MIKFLGMEFKTKRGFVTWIICVLTISEILKELIKLII